MGVLLMMIFYYYPTLDNVKYDLTIDQAVDYAQDGDLLFISFIRPEQMMKKFQQNMIRFYTGQQEWTHVALIIKINNEPFVMDTCGFEPDYMIPYHVTENPLNHCGFIHLRSYVDGFNGYVGIKRPRFQIDVQKYRDLCWHYHREIVFDLGPMKIFKKLISFLVPPWPLHKIKYRFSCAEAAASIYEELGIHHPLFKQGVFFEPFLEPHSPLFHQLILRVQPGRRYDGKTIPASIKKKTPAQYSTTTIPE